MKYRKDFVTNSSSSSYICEICGETESGYDICLHDVGMVECVNGHTFCKDHMIPFETNLSREEMINALKENKWFAMNHSDDYLAKCSDDDITDYYFENMICEDIGGYGVPEDACPICQFEEYSENDLSCYLEKKYGIKREEVFKEVRNSNKRRRKLYDVEYIFFVCNRFNLNPADVVAGWKTEFGTYKNLKNFLRNNPKNY